MSRKKTKWVKMPVKDIGVLTTSHSHYFFRDRYMNRGFLIGMPFMTVLSAVNRGFIKIGFKANN